MAVRGASGPDDAYVWGPIIAVLATALANLVAWALNERSWAYRRLLGPKLHVPRLLFISNRAEHVSPQARPQTYWSFDLLEPTHLVACPLLGVPGLLVLHAATFLYFVATVLVDVGIDWYGWGCHFWTCYQRTGGYPEWMSYLTNWSLSILGIAGAAAFANTLRFARFQRRRRRVVAAAAAAAGPGGPSQPAQPEQQQQVELISSALPGAPTPTPGGGAAHVRAAAHARGVCTSTSTSSDDDGNDTVVTVQDGGEEGQHHRSPARSGSPATSSSPAPPHPAADGKSDHPAGLPAWRWDALNRVHCLLMELATAAAWFVSFWFWVGVAPLAVDGFNLKNAGTLMAHAGNFGFALLQLLLTRLPIVSTHFQVVLVYATLYEVFLWAFGEGSSIWRYGLDWRRGRPAGAFVLVPLVLFIMFGLWWLLAVAREAALRRCGAAQQRRRQRRQARCQQHTAAAAAEQHA